MKGFVVVERVAAGYGVASSAREGAEQQAQGELNLRKEAYRCRLLPQASVTDFYYQLPLWVLGCSAAVVDKILLRLQRAATSGE